MEYVGYILTAVAILVVLIPMMVLAGKKLDKAVQNQSLEQERMQDLTRQIETVRQENAVLLAKQDILVQSYENAMSKFQQQLSG